MAARERRPCHDFSGQRPLKIRASYAGDTSDCTGHAREQMQMLTDKNSLSPTYFNEMGHIMTNFERALGTGFPKDLPLLLFMIRAETVRATLLAGDITP